MKNQATIFALLIFTSLTMGCGRELTKARKSNYGSGSVSMALREGDFICSERPQILPAQDALDGSGYYTVCQSQTSDADILVHGTTQSSTVVCIFPLLETMSGGKRRVVAPADVANGLPMVQCVDYTRFRVTGHFPGVTYNAVAIVEGPSRDQMQRCLASATINMNTEDLDCPTNYSYGRFRD